VFYWPVLGLALGITGGIIFAWVNKMSKQAVGYIYAWDLMGGAAGAVITSSLLLPVYGLRGLIMSLGILVFINLKVISKLRQ
jgi:hypothetical protein